MQSSEMQTILTEEASGIQRKLGDGYDSDVHVGKNRANAMVRASTYQAKKDNLKNNTLLKAMSK